MKPSDIYSKALATLIFSAAAAFLLVAHVDTPAESSGSTLKRHWDRLVSQACGNKNHADSLERKVQDTLAAITGLASDVRQNVGAESTRRSLLDSLEDTEASALDFLNDVGEFSRYMDRLCTHDERARNLSSSSLRDAADEFNDQVSRINTAQKNFSLVERRFNELLTSYMFHSESLESMDPSAN